MLFDMLDDINKQPGKVKTVKHWSKHFQST